MSMMYEFIGTTGTYSTEYSATDFRRNRDRIWMHDWCANREFRDLPADSLGTISRTASFTVNTDDTLWFYRQLQWRKTGGAMDSMTASYYAVDTFDFAVELVNAHTDARVKLLDSIGVLAQMPVKVPCLPGSPCPGTVIRHPCHCFVKGTRHGDSMYVHDFANCTLAGRIGDVPCDALAAPCADIYVEWLDSKTGNWWGPIIPCCQ